MYSWIPKQEPGRDPESIITAKSVIAAIIVCAIAGFAFPYYFRSRNMAKNKNLYAPSLKINGEDVFKLKTGIGSISFKIIGNGDDWDIVGDFGKVTLPAVVNKKLEITQNGNPAPVWLSSGREASCPIIVNEKYFHWRFSKIITEGDIEIELIFSKNFISDSQYTVCRLTYPR